MAAGMAPWIWAELRHRRRTLLLLTILSALIVTVGLAAVAGARRTTTAYDRFSREVDGSHVDVLMIAGFRGRSDVDLGNGRTASDVIAELRLLPQVAAIDTGGALQLGPPGVDFYTAVSFDDYAVNRPHVVHGRLPRGLEEIALSKGATKVLHKTVGDVIEMEGPSPDQAERLMVQGDTSVLQEPRAGPRLNMRIVGVVVSGGDIGTVDLSGPYGIVSEEFYDRYRNDYGQFGPGAQVRLKNGFRDLPGFRRQVQEIIGDSEIVSIEDKRTDVDAVNGGLRAQAFALYLFGAVATATGLVALASAVSRQLRTSSADMEVLSALGATRTQRTLSLFLVASPLVAAGMVLGVAGAFAASPLLPLGLARRAEPDPGLAFDAAAILVGAGVFVLLLGGIVGVTAWTASRRALRPGAEQAVPTSKSLVSRWISKAGIGPVGAIGLRLAFDRGSAAAPMPARTTVAMAVFAAAAVAAVLVFGASLSRLVDRPELSGFPWDAVLGTGQSLDEAAEASAALAADPDLEAVIGGQLSSLTLGDVTTQLFATHSWKGSQGLTIVRGRAPVGPDEAALGPQTLRRLKKQLGDTVELPTEDGGFSRLSIVGAAAFPIINFTDYDNGVWIPLEGLRGLAVAGSDAGVFVKVAPGANLDKKRGELEELGFNFSARLSPAKVANLKETEAFPRALAGFLALLGLLTLAHALGASPRRRRRDLALLRVLGFVRGQVAATLAVQATAVTVVAVLVGVPLGIATGRTLWNAVAAELSVVRHPIVPATVLLIAPAALLLANLLAVGPGRRAAAVRPAVILRTE